jgi:rubrerythrin
MSIPELLSVAVKSEIEAAKAYSKLYDSVKNAILKQKLKFLVLEEKKHRRILERLFKQRFPDQEIQIPKKSLLPPIKVSIGKPSLKSVSILDIFRGALKAEKAAENFYVERGSKVKDKESKRILTYLSRVERSHYSMIKSEIDLLDKFPDYYDVEDFHLGQDMFHVGP